MPSMSKYAGNTAIEIIIDSGKSNGIYDMAFINSLEAAADMLSDTRISGIRMANSYSLIEILKETNRALKWQQR